MSTNYVQCPHTKYVPRFDPLGHPKPCLVSPQIAQEYGLSRRRTYASRRTTEWRGKNEEDTTETKDSRHAVNKGAFDLETHFCGHPDPLVTIFCMSRKLPGVTGDVFGAAMEAGRASNTAPSSTESKPSTLAPKVFSRATTPGAFRDQVIEKREESGRGE